MVDQLSIMWCIVVVVIIVVIIVVVIVVCIYSVPVWYPYSPFAVYI